MKRGPCSKISDVKWNKILTNINIAIKKVFINFIKKRVNKQKMHAAIVLKQHLVILILSSRAKLYLQESFKIHLGYSIIEDNLQWFSNQIL